MPKVISQQRFCEKNSQWKGDKVGYIALHNWVRRRKPKPELCEDCKERKPYDLANITGKYKRDINDYKWLCRSCHVTYDYFNKSRKPKQGTPRIVNKGLFECLICKKLKPKTDFHKSKLEKYKIRKYCKDCRNKKYRENYHKNKFNKGVL
jgi:hypothetical protein